MIDSIITICALIIIVGWAIGFSYYEWRGHTGGQLTFMQWIWGFVKQGKSSK